MERRDHRLKLNGLQFHIIEWGAAEAYPIVMLHGIRGYAETFSTVAAALQPGHRVIAFDQRGRGDTDWDPDHNYYTDTYVADLVALVDALGLAQFDLLGHSMGGINAIVYAAHHPQRVQRLIIEDAGPGAFERSDGARRIRQELANTPSHFKTWDDAVAFMRALRPTVSEAARQQRLQQMLKPDLHSGWTWRYDHAGITATRLAPDADRVVDLRPHVQALRCPTLVLRGGRSDYLQADMVAEMQGLNPQLQAELIPDAGHYIHDDQPELFRQAVLRFLSPDHP